MNTRYSFTLLLLLLASFLSAGAQGKEGQRTDNPWQVDLAAGLHSFYLPGQGARFDRPELITLAGFGKPLGARQQFSVSLQVGYGRNNYQGDALQLQLLGQFTPVVAGKVEAGLGLGFGYRFALYGSSTLSWRNGEWKKGSAGKGLFQVPVQFSLGYRSLFLSDYELRPYIAYQAQALLGYNPDLPLMPVSAALLGVKFQKP
ncbi:MAG TPA: hypothetical protein VHK69_17170 [Chitinophagaceae bacterium]|jgi:hypothetical protein|nr:hypothetical protein [Chitinophagaceae bacterium]